MNKVQILVIEDDIAIGNLITTTLEMENYQFRRRMNFCELSGGTVKSAGRRQKLLL